MQTLKKTLQTQSFSLVNPGEWIRGFNAKFSEITHSVIDRIVMGKICCARLYY